MRRQRARRVCLRALEAALLLVIIVGAAPVGAATLSHSTTLETNPAANPLAAAAAAATPALSMAPPGSALGATAYGAWPAHAFHHHHRPMYAQQNLAPVLTSIEERLRALDALYSARFSPRLDALGADAQARRMDALDARLGRLETLIELRLDKLTETLSSRQLKDELSKDQLSRSMDSTMERLHHRMGYMETRLDVMLTKVQTSLETVSARVERLEPGLGLGRHSDAEHDALDDVRAGLEELRARLLAGHQRILNHTTAVAASAETAMQQHFERMSSALSHMQEELNRTLTVQNDGGGSGGNAGNSGGGGNGGGGTTQGQPLRHERHIGGNLLTAVERHASSFGSKVSNMYTELWRRTQVLEGLSKDTMALSNATRRELQEGLRSVSMQMGRYCSLQADKAKPGSNVKENFEATIFEMNHKMGDYFQRVISTQNVLLATCHRTQGNDPDFEKYLAHVLERMLDIMTSNKCQNEVEEVHQLLKSHHSTVVRNIGHNTNTILRAANSSSKESRNLANIINDRHDGILSETKDIQKKIINIHEENNNVQLALEEITEAINELQSQLASMSNRTTSSNFEDHMTEPDSIATLLKKKFEANQRHISEEIHNLTQTIKTILHNIASSLFPPTNDRTESLQKHIPTSTSSSKLFGTLQNNVLKGIKHHPHNIHDSQYSSTEAPKDLHHLDTSSITPPLNNNPISKPTESSTSQDLLTSTTPYLKTLPEKNTFIPELTINIIPDLKEEEKENETNFSKMLNASTKTHKSERSSEQAHHNQNKDETFLTIVHNDKPLTSDGHITYSSTVNTPNKETQGEPNIQEYSKSYSEQIDSQIPADIFHKDFHTLREQHNPSQNTEEHKNKSPFQLHEIHDDHMKEIGNHRNTSTKQSIPFAQHSHSNNKSTSEKLPHNTSQGKMLHTTEISETENKSLSQTDATVKNQKHTPHSIYHLLHKLEELSNKLMNYENGETLENDSSESSDDTQEDSFEESQEHSDHEESESAFSSD